MTAPTASMPSSADKGSLGVAHLKRYWAKIETAVLFTTQKNTPEFPGYGWLRWLV